MEGGLLDILKHIGLDLTWSSHFLTFALVMGRLVPCVILAPFLGGKSTPAEIKMALVMVLAIIVYPHVHGNLHAKVPDDPISFLFAFLKEIFIGLALGIVAEHVFYAIEMMGRFIDTARGSNMAEVMVPEMEGRATPVGDIYYQFTLCLVIALGGHRVYIESIANSFDRFPILSPVEWQSQGFLNFIEAVLRMGGDVLLIAVGLSLPCVAATFIVDVVFGLLNRVAPQLNAYFMAMPVKATGGIMMVFVSTTMFTERISVLIAEMLNDVNRMIEFFALR